MKRIIGIILLLFFTMSATAQMLGHSAHGNSFGFARNSSDSYLSKGYRGMVEMGHGVGTIESNYLFKLSTTHGYQFNPYLYLGGFVSLGTIEVYEKYRVYDYYWGDYTYKERFEPSFNFRLGADFRAYLPKKRVAPFVGLQLGFDYGADPGLGEEYVFVYLSGQIGLRVALKNRMGLNLAVQVGSEDYFGGSELIFKLGYEF